MSNYTYYLVSEVKTDYSVFAVLRTSTTSPNSVTNFSVPGTLEILAGELHLNSQSPREFPLFLITEEQAKRVIHLDETHKKASLIRMSLDREFFAMPINEAAQNPQLNPPVNKLTL